MSLIKCPECGQNISSESRSCIHCGYPLENNVKLYRGIKVILSSNVFPNFREQPKLEGPSWTEIEGWVSELFRLISSESFYFVFITFEGSAHNERIKGQTRIDLTLIDQNIDIKATGTLGQVFGETKTKDDILFAQLKPNFSKSKKYILETLKDIYQFGFVTDKNKDKWVIVKKK